ncbi:MAG TPA: YetF domain-containing protein, partial [Balneolaceae bacterium]|nr:YetF domain-containing protein [Balneolaceae bacterium]
MGLILRAVIIYLTILIIFRMSGKRTLSQLTTFDFILLLMVGEATQEALLMDDQSIIGSLLIIGTLVSLDVIFAWFSKRSVLFDKIANGVPVIILKNGELIEENMQNAQIEMNDILEAARRDQGLESLEQVKYAVLEKDGKISIIP